ncbi:MAG: hypothetical protein QOH33_2375, partial [Paraburkholderia sp.]|nr:hypothetical protein [Paraburkholderia sp.]
MCFPEPRFRTFQTFVSIALAGLVSACSIV